MVVVENQRAPPTTAWFWNGSCRVMLKFLSCTESPPLWHASCWHLTFTFLPLPITGWSWGYCFPALPLANLILAQPSFSSSSWEQESRHLWDAGQPGSLKSGWEKYVDSPHQSGWQASCCVISSVQKIPLHHLSLLLKSHPVPPTQYTPDFWADDIKWTSRVKKKKGKLSLEQVLFRKGNRLSLERSTTLRHLPI